MFRPGISLPGTHAEGEQPRPVEDVRQPTAAERVRTLVQSSVSALLTIPGTAGGPDEPGSGTPEARTVTVDGDVILLVPADSPEARACLYAQDDDLTAVMEITDVAPVSVPHRIRGRAWVAGWLTPVRNDQRAACARLLAEANPAVPAAGTSRRMLRLEVGEAYIDDLWGAEPVEPDEFAEAAPDPLAAHEAELLQHLASAHADQVKGLCACRTGESVVPLAIDRFGLRVRGWGESGGCVDARFEFPEPVGSVAELRHAMHALFTAARG
ncbi:MULTISPECIES: DUF2470 domain-containing protein [unclassified Streptomyces]|uniref:DUF2470 domain-containing protein n=1 Tax=unclassified Streptomyces TaxID=2593676 RepID=UPI002DDAE423|nr:MULTISPECIES: DUF2470 domain-containing protein [unclassified Streptomyces]WSA96306.1 DUF2470 domain-containing protein [Streptomyces sp. NBC_01795]WSB80720.1 DUF2470 domain-containing protein [Streptomyces sp. NBC_01775]WSS11071.1 DUF2470 domain-containing protein [Streptomyces sp. NBC_01186]WSS39779.1 DUF2470 domain-containing protein [Streptomyces sp. NBC_01187]